MAKRLVYGIGVNDANYQVNHKIDGVVVRCPFYRAWSNMLGRCYSEKFLSTRPTYQDCSVADEWHSFMAFKSWMETQDWKGNCLDKDILIPDNKVYSESTCVFITNELNNFLTTKENNGQKYPMGVLINEKVGNYSAQIRLGSGKRRYLGVFETPELAHRAWKNAKAEHALEVAANQTDPRVSMALINRYKEA